MSRRHPTPGGVRVDLVIDDPALAARLREEAKRSGSSVSEVIRTSLAGALPARPSVSLCHPEPDRPRPEDLPTDELRALVDAALAAWAEEPDPDRKARLQRDHLRVARILGQRVRAERAAALSGKTSAG